MQKQQFAYSYKTLKKAELNKKKILHIITDFIVGKYC